LLNYEPQRGLKDIILDVAAEFGSAMAAVV
jgi:hypothetical protein